MDELTRLYEMIFQTEVDYLVAQDRRNDLLAIPNPTAAQTEKIADLQTKLDRDNTAVAAWIAKIATLEGRTQNQIKRRLWSQAPIVTHRNTVITATALEFGNVAAGMESTALQEEQRITFMGRITPEETDLEYLNRLGAFVKERDKNVQSIRNKAAKVLNSKAIAEAAALAQCLWGIP